MASEIISQPFRIALEDLDDIGLEAVVDFCRAHAVRPLPESIVRRLLTTLTSGRGGRIGLTIDGELALVASAADVLTSEADCGVLDLLAWRGGSRDSALANTLIDAMLIAAEAFIASGDRSGLEVPVAGPLVEHVERLTRRGYERVFSTYAMHLDAIDVAGPTLPPSGSWRWEPTSAARVDAHASVVRSAFARVPGSYAPPADESAAAMLAAPEKHQVLLDGDVVAAFAHVETGTDGIGNVRMIGRAPAYRGRGLGRFVLEHALALLAAAGAASAELDVAANNRAALGLYERRGFAVVEETPYYRWRLR